MTNTIYDITHESDAIMLVGSNPEHAHPVLGMQVRQAVERGAKLIVVDPRNIDLTKQADVHLKLRPGTNVAFANGMMNVFIEEDLVDKKFIEERTENFEAIKEMVKDYTPEKLAKSVVSTLINSERLQEFTQQQNAHQLCTVLVLLNITQVQKVLCPCQIWL